MFDLDYSVKFPLSLVLSRKSITYYQMIFRHLLRLKHLERNFQETWTEHLKTPAWRRRSPYSELQAFKGRVFALRARMYDFVKQVFDFAVSEVLEVRWAELRKKLEGCETVDQLLKDHDNFLNTCTNECLLTHQSLLEVRPLTPPSLCWADEYVFAQILHQKLFNTCYVFNSYTTTFTLIVVQSEAEANGDWARVSSGKFKEHWTFLDRFVPSPSLPFSPTELMLMVEAQVRETLQPLLHPRASAPARRRGKRELAHPPATVEVEQSRREAVIPRLSPSLSSSVGS